MEEEPEKQDFLGGRETRSERQLLLQDRRSQELRLDGVGSVEVHAVDFVLR